VAILREDQQVKEKELAQQEGVIANQREQVEMLQSEMRSARYIVAPIKTLVRDGIIVQRRVLLSKVWKIAPTLDPAKLEQIDTAEKTALTIEAARNRIEIISPHPPDSFSLAAESGTRCLLSITDSARFWTTKYLVVGIR
jgi:hypothetical protein